MHRLAFVIPALLVVACRASGDAGLVDRTVEVGGVERQYHIHVPAPSTPGKLPLVIVLHGGGGTGDGMARLVKHRFEALADRDGFVVVYPEGIGHNWNDGRTLRDPAHAEHVDDVAFISTLIDSLVASEGVDPRRVYVTGLSNGAIMCHRLAFDLSSRIAAIAPVCGSIPREIMGNAPTSGPAVSVLAMNGTADPLVPYEGGQVHLGRIQRGEVISVADTIKYWVQRDGCPTDPEVERLDHKDEDDATHVRRERHVGDHAEVVLYVVEGGGHTWAGGKQYLPEAVIGKTSHDMDACDVIWDFFKAHPRPYP